ncbi:MAG: glycosyltransferase family 4 protein [Candidatus Schekmanbacteria bacterium]|nr:glycosyltransferase family 4 protein [Candidatus Schekmanbacteria bacterium]
MKPVKVLHVITRLDRGGSAENTLITVMNLDRGKYTPSLLYGLTLSPDVKYFEKAKESASEFSCIPDLVRKISPLHDLKAFYQIYSFIKKGNYQILHTHSSKAGILGRWAGWLAGVPVIVHTPHGHVFYGYYVPLVSKLFVWAEKISALITDRIITLTERGKKEHIRFGVAKPDKFIPIHSGVDIGLIQRTDADKTSQCPKSHISLRETLSMPAGAIVAASMGRLSRVKGYEYFIKAGIILSKKYDDIYFAIAGEGELRENLEQIIKNAGAAERFKFAGWREDIGNFLNGADIFVLSSLNEGMGKAIVEAMAAGLPVVGTDVGGISEIVVEGETGFIVPPGNAEAIADRIERLYLDKNLRSSMGERGRERAALYDTHSMVRKVESLYEEVLKEKKLQ